jgi:hypothetical protein
MALFHPLEEKFVVAGIREEWVKRCEEALRATPHFQDVASSAELFRVSARYRRPPVWGDVQVTLTPEGSGSTRLMDAHPILNGSLKDIDVYDCEMSELDAVARNTGLADRAAIGARQVGLIVEAKHIDRNASRVGAQANTVKLSRRPIGVGDGAGAVANVRVGHNLAVRVRAIGGRPAWARVDWRGTPRLAQVHPFHAAC